MSVQAGIWNFDGRPVDPSLIAAFSESLKQQGPDGESSYVDGSITLLYRPFQTTAESRREKQPYTSRRGFILTWDGRLDNRGDLIADLRSDLEAEPTDVAIVSAAFDRWDEGSFRRIVGDWAVSIWKPELNELVFAVDYLAIRHIFYYLKNDRIWWSTDLTPLVLLSGNKFHVDDDYIAGYFANDADAHLTPYCEIREVPPGQFVSVRNRIASVERYWRFSPTSCIRYKTDAEYEEHFRHLFRQSVRLRLRSDSPILAELSGGLDSSSIVCMADDILAKEGAQTSRLDTLSLYDKTEPNGDDWLYFSKIEEKRGRVGAHIDASTMGSAPASFEHPEFMPLPGYLGAGGKLETERSTVMRNGGYRAVLSGIGGDEFMGGVPNPSALLADLIVQFKLVSLSKQLMAWSLVKRRPWVQLFWQAVADLLPPSLGQYFVKQKKVEPWIEEDFANRTRIVVRQLDGGEHFGIWLPTRRSYIGSVMLMARKLAKASPSREALEEARFPFLDKNLIEFILSVPASQVLRPGERRSLMRRSLIGIVPNSILSRRTKQFGARTPVAAVGRNWEELQTALHSPLVARYGYVNGPRFIEALHAAKNGQEIHIVRMLRTISLEFWLRSLAARDLLDGESIAPRSHPERSGRVPASESTHVIAITPASQRRFLSLPSAEPSEGDNT